ncbi:hypothetical protein C8R44DRAFT_869300 [Mycena epipterygia]|nr:hypothetical protein C8R44DRAFT_869300 [Mycena epipterygia]
MDSSGKGEAGEKEKEIARVQHDLARIWSSLALHHTYNEAPRDVGAVSQDVAQLASEVKDEFGIVYGDIRSAQDAIRRLTTREESYATLEARVDTLATANDEVRAAITQLKLEMSSNAMKRHELEIQVLKARQRVADIQLPSAQATGGTKLFALGNMRKRAALNNEETFPTKRARCISSDVGERQEYKHWVQMGPVKPSIQGTPRAILDRMLKAAFETPPVLPVVFVKKNSAGTDLLVGFVKEVDAVALMRSWNDEPARPFPDVVMILARAVASNAIASGSGMTAREKEIAALSEK